MAAPTTYAELQTALADWVNVDNLTEVIKEAITYTENWLVRELQVVDIEAETTVDTTAGQDYIDLPTGFIGLHSVYIHTSQKKELAALSLVDIREDFDPDTTGVPEYYAIALDKMFLAPTPDDVYTLYFTYYKFDNLSDSQTTNTVLTKHPDLYMIKSLQYVWGYLHNYEQEQKCYNQSSEMLRTLKKHDKRLRFGRSKMVIRAR